MEESGPSETVWNVTWTCTDPIPANIFLETIFLEEPVSEEDVTANNCGSNPE
jgi:hypothetical protein